ncbi:hypothetical protein PoB_004088700 [Plakobranchus ocellatus]|uniref:Uncharacterized protein n=1 Tax=Plakobranchus ocellatus TaxID=259542 RepID=A0AAV4B5B7_9GAST|nr:hypothetical protein PoB_004088700 [Plakobranchus ocellatus]
MIRTVVTGRSDGRNDGDDDGDDDVNGANYHGYYLKLADRLVADRLRDENDDDRDPRDRQLRMRSSKAIILTDKADSRRSNVNLDDNVHFSVDLRDGYLSFGRWRHSGPEIWRDPSVTGSRPAIGTLAGHRA